MKLYTADWVNDAKLKLCSPGAQGLWIFLCCVMHTEMDEVGYLRISGNVLGPEDVAALWGQPCDVVAALWDELERWNVIKKTEDGCVFSSRMVRDEERSQQGRMDKLAALATRVHPDNLEATLEGSGEETSKEPLVSSLLVSKSLVSEKEIVDYTFRISSKLLFSGRSVLVLPAPTKKNPDLDVPAFLADNEEWRTKFKEWAEYRRTEKRNSLTWTSVRNQLKDMERAGAEASIKAMETAMTSGWTGVFPDESKATMTKQRGRGTDQDRETRRRQFENLEERS